MHYVLKFGEGKNKVLFLNVSSRLVTWRRTFIHRREGRIWIQFGELQEGERNGKCYFDIFRPDY